ncbi:hypothetical protein [Collinsella sp. AF08-23]|uniref:hypothetical protein n=1 Tax=Collinsella sp. AF08-23 TaxID=2292211 RepID=UPI000E47C838|nr:hypothetical protein [Collinsella sp. AF08-23]RHS40605.1 hypothetical protein DWV48_03540 [Collinsella sp. AF08-23]
MSDIEPFFNSAEECAAYEMFCAEQERGLEKFELADPALVCRWRMNRRQVPLINRHIRALSQRVVNGAPLTTNMLSWAKQHVEWSLAAGEYEDPNGVLMLVIDVNGDALMSVGPYEPLADTSRAALVSRASIARAEAAGTGVAPELLGVLTADGRVLLAATPGEALCGAATLVEQLAAVRGHAVERSLVDGVTAEQVAGAAGEGDAVFLISDEHGVVVERGATSGDAAQLSADVRKLFA